MSLSSARRGSAAQPAPSRTPFGRPEAATETRGITSTQDAVRRARWIALDIGASDFGIFTAAPSAKRPMLVPWLDSEFPGRSLLTEAIAAEERAAIVRHIRHSTVPLWWAQDETPSAEALVSLAWCERIEPLTPATCGLAFPVQATRGQSGLVVFFGSCLALESENLYDIHARCFALFDALSQSRLLDGELRAISKRELECLKLTASGYTSGAIAAALKLSVHTANQYLTNTTQKLNAANRTHAVAKALRMGLIE